MINKMILFVLMTALVALAAPQMGAMTDSRDGKSYRTVKIGNQVLLAGASILMRRQRVLAQVAGTCLPLRSLKP